MYCRAMCTKNHICPMTVEHWLFREFPGVVNQWIERPGTSASPGKAGPSFIEAYKRSMGSWKCFLLSSYYTDTVFSNKTK